MQNGIKNKAIAEFIGTFAIVFIGCGSIMVQERFPGSISPILIPLLFGLVVAAMVYAVGHISGAHFNPAVTLGFAVTKNFPLNQVVVYWFAQFLGAFAALFFLRFSLPEGISFGSTIAHIPQLAALAWEFILCFFLMFVISAVATDTRAEGSMAGLAIGITIALCAAIGGPVTGASMNPARSLAPAFFEGQISSLWIYFVGPLAGACTAALTYEWIRCGSQRKEARGCC